jgi:hypothetical protein
MESGGREGAKWIAGATRDIGGSRRQSQGVWGSASPACAGGLAAVPRRAGAEPSRPPLLVRVLHEIPSMSAAIRDTSCRETPNARAISDMFAPWSKATAMKAKRTLYLEVSNSSTALANS